jgi:hypothetical protein
VAVVAVVVVEDEVEAAHAHFARDVLTARDVLLCSFRKLSLTLSLTLSLISLETFSLLISLETLSPLEACSLALSTHTRIITYVR